MYKLLPIFGKNYLNAGLTGIKRNKYHKQLVGSGVLVSGKTKDFTRFRALSASSTNSVSLVEIAERYLPEASLKDTE
jgi:hypothetical protein